MLQKGTDARRGRDKIDAGVVLPRWSQIYCGPTKQMSPFRARSRRHRNPRLPLDHYPDNLKYHF